MHRVVVSTGSRISVRHTKDRTRFSAYIVRCAYENFCGECSRRRCSRQQVKRTWRRDRWQCDKKRRYIKKKVTLYTFVHVNREKRRPLRSHVAILLREREPTLDETLAHHYFEVYYYALSVTREKFRVCKLACMRNSWNTPRNFRETKKIVVDFIRICT